jgi:hypothetical protein
MNGITPILLECLAGFYVAAFESTAEPRYTLLGGTVREPIRGNALTGHPLDSIVANGRRGVQALLEITGLELDLPKGGPSWLCRLVTPDTGEAVSLKLQPHGERVLLIGPRLLHLSHLRLDAEQVLNMVAELVRKNVGLREVAGRTEPFAKLAEETEVEIHERVAGTVEGTGC